MAIYGKGLMNDIINKLPFELHIPWYNYCGPGTRYVERIERGDKGINPLDEACKEHDGFYHNNDNTKERHKADLILANKAWNRVKSKDANFKERVAAYGITNAMKAKIKLGMGINSQAINMQKKLWKI